MTRRPPVIRRPLTAEEAKEVREIIRKVEWTRASAPGDPRGDPEAPAAGIPLPGSIANRLCFIDESGALGGTRTPDLLVRRKAVKNSKCCFWCRLQRNAPFISLLNWTEVGLK